MYEHKQRRLALDDQSLLEHLWETFPKVCRAQLIEHYARLIGAAIWDETASNDEEPDHDQNSGR